MHYANFFLHAWMAIKLASSAIPLKDNSDSIPLKPWSPQLLVQYQRLLLPWFMYRSFGGHDDIKKAWVHKRENSPMAALKYGPMNSPTISEAGSKDLSQILIEGIQNLPDHLVLKPLASISDTKAASQNRKQLDLEKRAKGLPNPHNAVVNRYETVPEDSGKGDSDTKFNWLYGDNDPFASEKFNSGVSEADDYQVMKQTGTSPSGKRKTEQNHVQHSKLDRPYFPVMMLYKSDKHLQVMNNDNDTNKTNLSIEMARNYGMNGFNGTKYSKVNELGSLSEHTNTAKTTDSYEYIVGKPKTKAPPVAHRVMKRSAIDKRIHFCGFLGRQGRPIGTCLRRIRPKAAASFSAYDYLGPHWSVHSILGGGVG